MQVLEPLFSHWSESITMLPGKIVSELHLAVTDVDGTVCVTDIDDTFTDDVPRFLMVMVELSKPELSLRQKASTASNPCCCWVNAPEMKRYAVPDIPKVIISIKIVAIISDIPFI